MLFNKHVTELEFSDINTLKDTQFEESDILDYKERIDDDNNVLKEIAAFSNSRGGYLIYGIRESGRGAKGSSRGSYPEEIIGIDRSYNCERLEQLIIGNIMPRVSVQIQKVPMPDPDKIILVIRIPEGQNKPYYNNRGQKYFKRYNFDSTPMLEHEIEAMYRERFFGVSNLSRYVSEVVSFNHNLIPFENRSKIIYGHIILSPLRIEDKIMDTSNEMRIGLELSNSQTIIPGSSKYLYGAGEPSKYGIRWNDKLMHRLTEIHKNGLIYFMGRTGSLDDEKILQFSDRDLCYYLLNTILFADTVYSKFDFEGKVKIIAKIMNCLNSRLYIPKWDRDFYDERNRCEAEEITVEREWDSWKLKDDYLVIGKSIMDEIANCYGFWESRYLIGKEGSIILAK